jgi:hypothetical protein
MGYTFAGLSPADFEDIVRDLVGRDLGLRFEAFATGPDAGIDGRHAKGDQATILQAKHLVGSSFATLKSKMKLERASINRLSPARYVLATSRPLTPPNKQQLALIIGPSLRSQTDIIGPKELNALLRSHPDIEKSHIKLWLSGTAVLERVVHAAAHSFNNLTQTELEKKVTLYAPNPSFGEAQKRLKPITSSSFLAHPVSVKPPLQRCSPMPTSEKAGTSSQSEAWMTA